LCNVAYAWQMNDITEYRRMAEANGAEFKIDLAEQIENFEIEIGQRFDPEQAAIDQLKAAAEAQGIEWDETPVTATGGKEDDGLPDWMRT
jgi:hypothetical protein